jgi:hypothetical protein
VSGLFSRLAARARGLELEPGAAHPLLPTPYELPAREPLEDFDQRLDEAEPQPVGSRSGAELAHDDGVGDARLVARESAAPSASTEGGAAPEPWSAPAAEAPLLRMPVSTSTTASVRRLATSTNAGGTRTEASAEARGSGVVAEPAAEPARAFSPVQDAENVSAAAPHGAPFERTGDDDAPLMPRLPARPLEPRATSESVGARRARAAAGVVQARPVVKVTIGRIDVRGAPAASSPTRPTPAPARHVPQALDAFLRRDETRGRR